MIFDLKNKVIYLKNEFRTVNPFSDEVMFTLNSEGNVEIGFINMDSNYYQSGFRVGDIISFEDSMFEEEIKRNPCNSRIIVSEYLNNKQQLPNFIKK